MNLNSSEEAMKRKDGFVRPPLLTIAINFSLASASMVLISLSSEEIAYGTFPGERTTLQKLQS